MQTPEENFSTSNTRLLVLDFDGTMADTRGVIVRTFHDTLRAMGLPDVADEAIIATIGLPLVEAFPVVTGGCDAAMAARCTDTYRRLFARNNLAGAVRLFPNVASTLRRLHAEGMTLAIASSRGHESLDDYVLQFGLQDIVAMVVGAEDVARAKPDPEPVLTILRRLGFQPGETVVVGDAAYDMLMAVRAGCTAIGVSYGNNTPEQLAEAGASRVIDDFGALYKLTSKQVDE